MDEPLFRLSISPSRENALKTESQIMVDKINAVRREHITKKIGRINEAEATSVERALAMWLEIGQFYGPQ